MSKIVGGPHRGHAAGKTDTEKAASQLASDVKYKVNKQLEQQGGRSRLNPAQVAKAYLTQWAKSPAAPAVKALAKKKLMGEEYISNISELAEKSVVNALIKVFVESVEETKEPLENDYLLQLEEVEEKKYKIRVTDKKTGNSYVRMATRAKISELRANPNISSVEMTAYGEISKTESSKGSSTAKAKAGKGLDPVGKEDSDPDNDGKHNDPNDKYIMKRRKAIGKAIATRTEEVIYEKEGDDTSKKITGKGVNNKKIIKVFPTSVTEQASLSTVSSSTTKTKSPEQRKQEQQNDKTRQQEAQILARKLQALRSAPKGSDPAIMASYEPEGDQISEKEDSPYEKASDAALDSRYGYGRASGDKRSFGRAANRSSAAAALRAIRRGERSGSGTSTEAGADAVHKGWAKTAKTSTDQTPEKKAKRAGLANTEYKDLPDDEKEKDRVSFNAVRAVYKARKSNLSASYEPDGDDIQEVAPPGMEKTVKKMKKHPELSRGTTPEGKKKSPYALAWYMYNKKKGIEEECECEDEKEPKLKKSEGGTEDPREIPTKTNLVKNKLRAMGLKMSYEPEGEVVEELSPTQKAALAAVKAGAGPGLMTDPTKKEKLTPEQKKEMQDRSNAYVQRTSREMKNNTRGT